MGAYYPCHYSGHTVLLERYIILSHQPCLEEEYDLFSLKLNDQLPDYTSPDFSLSSYECLDDLSRECSVTFRNRAELVGHRVCLYTQVVSKTTTKVIVNTMCYKGKLWINGKCLIINSLPFDDSKYITATLKKGVNHVVFEQWVASANTQFYVQLRNYKFECGEDVRALSHMFHILQLNPLVLIQDPPYLPVEPVFRFMYMKNDGALSREYRVEVHDSKRGLVQTCCGKMDQPVTIDIKKLRDLDSKSLRHAWVRCIFLDRNGNEFVTGPNIVVKNFLSKAQEIDEKLSRIIAELPTEAHYQCGRNLELSRKITAEGAYLSKYWLVCQGKELLTRLEKGDYCYKNIYEPGVHEVLLHSELDDTVIRITVGVPEHYDKNRSYPAVIGLATTNSCEYAYLFYQMLGRDFIYLDATGRGFTGGSYIGEASTLELLEWLKRNYKIDEDRLYLLGYSNGAIAAYALAQTHPDLAAAIFPNAGIPQMEALENLSNVPIYTLVSPKDYVCEGREHQAKGLIGKYHNYHQYDFSEMLHPHFYFYLFNREIFRKLTGHTRNRYPETVIFRTSHNRHLQSFWVRLHGISKNKKTARVKAKILGRDRIAVVVSNAAGLTLTVPEQIDRSHFAVSINGCMFDFCDFQGKELHFEWRRCWRQTDGRRKIDFRKGTGILDVYLGSMRIIIPHSPTGPESKIAQTFSEPDTNGADPKVYVKYPIYLDSDTPGNLFSHHLIFVDREYRNLYSARFGELFPIRYDAAGFDYQGKRYEGGYVILQVAANPYDNRRTVLNISFNDETLLRKFIPIRKMVIPTYINGIHPYFNHEVLIFWGGKYYGIYEQNGQLLPL